MELQPTPVTIGIAVRYEDSASLRCFVGQLSAAARLLDTHTESEVCFCVNGASSDVAGYLKDALQELPGPNLCFTCLQSSPGKIRAHEMIARNRQLKGFLLFADADTRLDETLFLRLYQFLQTRPDLQACYAEVEALPSVAPGLFGRLQDAYYANRRCLPPRKYLHGRCFLLRSWIEEFGALRSTTVSCFDETNEKLGLHHGPIVDDIHYSRVIVHRFGAEAIAPVPDAARIVCAASLSSRTLPRFLPHRGGTCPSGHFVP